ncbi:MAG: shikimate dehydrogenase, partial [Thermodesulfobacteriota bacterium]|nr:shikimate dehydrogenase [Thermodesulfobacteriota bacterium]
MKGQQKTYALFGDPVKHSLSPVMHNAAFRKCKTDASYIAISVKQPIDIIRKIKELNLQGCSITIPHKTAVMEYLDRITDCAKEIGAVNTVICSDTGLTGDNTDWIGIVQALRESTEIQGKSIVILGAGGTARAALFGILKEGGIPVILNRTAKRGEALAREFGCEFYPLEDISKISGDCLINTTPVGMAGYSTESPVRSNGLENFPVVMDVIYNPLKTKLLKDAEGVGCVTVSGLSMFVCQGAEQ